MVTNKISADSSYPLSTSWFPKASTNETKRSDASFHPFKRLPDELFRDMLWHLSNILDSQIGKHCLVFGICCSLGDYNTINQTDRLTFNTNCLQGQFCCRTWKWHVVHMFGKKVFFYPWELFGLNTEKERYFSAKIIFAVFFMYTPTSVICIRTHCELSLGKHT